MTNKEIVDLVFDKIQALGFKPYDITHPDGYFLFESEKDSVTHFRLKGKGMWKHWLFGLWVNAEYMTEEEFAKTKERHNNGVYKKDPTVIQLFAQYDTNIDKFKPSRSELLFQVYNDSLKLYLDKQDKYIFYQLEDMLKMIVRHPFMCYNGYCGGCVGFHTGSFIANFIKTESYHKYKKIEKFLKKSFWFPYTKFKIAICKRSKIVHDIELYDFNKNNQGWRTNYLYQVNITFTEYATDEQMLDWLDFWWKQHEYGKLKLSDCVIEVGSFKQIGHDKPFKFY